MFGMQSCTVKKRLYQPGYHVEWYNKIKGNKPECEKEIAAASISELVIQSIVEHNEIQGQQPMSMYYSNDFEDLYASNSENLYTHNDEIVIHKDVITSKPGLPNSAIYKNETACEHKNENSKYKQTSIDVENNSSKIHYAAIIGLALCILGFGILPFVALATNIGMVIILAGISPLSMVLGFLFAIYAKDKINSNSDKYKGILLVKISLIMCIVYAALLLLGAIVRLWS